MQYIISYDIADDRRRSHLASALLDFGARVQESVFVANLDDELAGRMKERVAKLIDEQWDRVHIFELCQSCAGRTRVFGSGEIIKDHEFYVI
ncbi:MAG TPA: CRISPR-associated endonuclease Cas2 [Candidatus Saccharimonadales bacterium]|nr:CRISPR-associated endonuclease Cas2 [Candidatus Saccharimonadales bacterium]